MSIARKLGPRKLGWVLSMIVGAVGLARSAQAVLILPGQSLTPNGSGAFTASPPTPLSDTGNQAFTGTNGASGIVFTGIIDSKVYHDASSGGLDFVYQFSNDSTSLDKIESLTVGGFAGLTTDADYIPSTGATVPTSVLRSSTGKNVGFDFTGTGAVSQGTNTDILVIKTNATQYQIGAAVVQDGGNGTAVVLVPAVPEPATAALAGLVFAACGLRRRRRA